MVALTSFDLNGWYAEHYHSPDAAADSIEPLIDGTWKDPPLVEVK